MPVIGNIHWKGSKVDRTADNSIANIIFLQAFHSSSLSQNIRGHFYIHQQIINHLFHEACLSITISILLWIQFIHQAGLRVSGGGGVMRASGSRMTRSGLVSIGQRGCPCGASTAKGSSNRARLAAESIGTLLTATKVSALALELVHGDGRKLAGSMVLGLILVNLMDGNSGVYNGGLDSLLLDHWLDLLVYMVVDVLACNSWVGRGCLLSVSHSAGVLELSLFGGQTLLGVFVRAVLDIAVLYTSNLVGVLLREDFTVLDWLNGGVVMVLVYLAVDSSGFILMLCAGDVLVLNSGVDCLYKN